MLSCIFPSLVLSCVVFQGPTVTIDALYLDFGLLAVGESVSKQLPIFNHSQCPVRFHLTQAAAGGKLPVEDLEWDEEGLPKLPALVLHACLCTCVCGWVGVLSLSVRHPTGFSLP